MRVLFASTSTLVAGGHKVQEANTADALRAAGIEVDVSEDVADASSVAGYDVVHGWWPSLSLVRAARRQRIPVVVSTVYWSRTHSHSLNGQVRHGADVRRRLLLMLALGRQGARLLHLDGANALLAHETYLRMLFESADLLLPNSESEADLIQRELGVSTPSHVVPNAADADLFTWPPTPDTRDGVVCVARIEPAKNQLNLIRALRGTGLRLTIVGADHAHHSAYARACRRAADSTVAFLGAVEQSKLPAVYQRHRVHVLPSWWETTGLVSLEAALSGCAVVSTALGGSREYLGSDAWYVNPGDVASIRQAVLQAYRTGPSRALAARVQEGFSWRQTALRTTEAYRSVIAAGCAAPG